MAARKYLGALWFALAGLFLFGSGIVYQWYVNKNPVYPLTLPGDLLESSKDNFFDTLQRAGFQKPDYFFKTNFTQANTWHDPKAAQAGLTLMTSVNKDERLQATIVELDGAPVQTWSIDWFSLWPNTDHLPDIMLPKRQPGTHVHGAVVMENGDLVFNFEYLGMMRLNACGDVVWRLPYQTHHSIDMDENTGNLWVSGRIYHSEPTPKFPNHTPPFSEPTAIEVSPDGDILKEISVIELLQKNDLHALLHMKVFDNVSSKNERSKAVATGDTLHLNDVEAFPRGLPAGRFKPGDLMLSLRNIHTVLVFDPRTEEIVYRQTGGFVGQHDPDFIDGNTISVFDNAVGIGDETLESRVVMLSGDNDAAEPQIYYKGNDEAPFYTQFMGKHQWLSNGNLLLTESMAGRAFEIDKHGDIVWQYVNLIDDEGMVGLIEEAQRLPRQYDRAFFEDKRRTCEDPQKIASESHRTG